MIRSRGTLGSIPNDLLRNKKERLSEGGDGG